MNMVFMYVCMRVGVLCMFALCVGYVCMCFYFVVCNVCMRGVYACMYVYYVCNCGMWQYVCLLCMCDMCVCYVCMYVM